MHIFGFEVGLEEEAPFLRPGSPPDRKGRSRGWDDPVIRVLVAVDPFEQRQALAYAVRRRRPCARMLTVPPEELVRRAAQLTPDVIVCHPAGRAACASSLFCWVELGNEHAAEGPDSPRGTAEVLGPRSWTIGRDEIARVLADVDERDAPVMPQPGSGVGASLAHRPTKANASADLPGLKTHTREHPYKVTCNVRRPKGGRGPLGD